MESEPDVLRATDTGERAERGESTVQEERAVTAESTETPEH